jgi:hypothetical protein
MVTDRMESTQNIYRPDSFRTQLQRPEWYTD